MLPIIVFSEILEQIDLKDHIWWFEENFVKVLLMFNHLKTEKSSIKLLYIIGHNKRWRLSVEYMMKILKTNKFNLTVKDSSSKDKIENYSKFIAS